MGVKLLPFPPAHSRKCYKFGGVCFPSVFPLPLCITELTGMRTYDSLARSDVTLTSYEIEELKSSSLTLLEAHPGWVVGCILTDP